MNNELQPSAPIKDRGDMKPLTNQSASEPSKKRSRFPTSKRVEFVGALGLVIWVLSELMATHDGSKLIVQWLIISLFLVPVCYYISKWVRNSAAGHLLYYPLIVIVAVIAYLNSLTPAFSVVAEEWYFETKNPRHFLYWNINNRHVRSPINGLMLVHFTNLRDKAMSVSSYQFEGRTKSNTWEVLPSMDVSGLPMASYVGKKWGTNGFRGLILGPINDGDTFVNTFGDDVFPKTFRGRIIAPGATVLGYAFLEAKHDGFDGSIRLKIHDVSGEEFVAPLTKFRESNALETEVYFLTSGANIGLKAPKEVESSPIVPYSEACKPN